MLHEDGLTASVAATVEDRTGRFKGATFEVRSIVEDFSMQTLGGMEVAKILLERALLSSLLYGASTWLGVDTRTEDKCDELLYMYWRVMFSVPDGTPKISLIAESGTVRTKWRIWLEKIQLVNRIYRKDSDCLARRVYEEQLQNSWPGLAMEVTQICQIIGIPDVNRNVVSKQKIKEAVFYNHYKDLKEGMNKYTKLEAIKHQNFTEMQPYLKDKSIDKCRTKFRLRTEMLEPFKDNFRRKYRTLERGQEEEDPGLQCQDCQDSPPPARDSQVHCLVCPAWTHLR